MRTLPNIPQWRLSGYAISGGQIHGKDVAQCLLVSLAQPLQERSQNDWQEVILVDQKVSPEQVQMLLELFEDRLDSLPAEVKPLPTRKKAVYRTRMEYLEGAEEVTLHIAFVPDSRMLLRAGDSGPLPRAWTYDGPMALRECFDLHTSSI